MSDNSRSFSIAGFVLGILSLVVLPVLCVVTFLLGDLPTFVLAANAVAPVVGIVLSAIGLRRNLAGKPGHGLAVAGLVLSIVALVLGILSLVALLMLAVVLVANVAMV